MDLFHCLSRGVDKRKIFLDNQDRLRFIHDLFEFNDRERVNNTFYTFQKHNDIASREMRKAERRPRKLLVDIHAFCLMPNHYHLLLSARVENGIPQFMKKLNMGYAKYFNQKYKRQGTLFESRYKSVPVKSHAHFVHLPYYIHLNPLDLAYPEWREKKIKSVTKALRHLEKYRWSSHLDYLGKKNFPSVTRRDFLTELFGGPENYRNSIRDWLQGLDLEAIREVSLE
jgi:putative transposase